MKNILEVDQLNKSFDTYDNELKRFLVWFGLSQKPKITKNVLESVSFNIAQGEAVGIVGRNGAGKSTLLKIITGTLTPNSGYVRAAGQVSAILELGMGFSPDMTGRQNAYHSAGLMGYTHSQIKEVIDDIEEFAEIGEYFEQPVRTYSSGMQARLSFSVATAFRPDLLIVDEALSVGDVYFQSKCFARMNNMKSLGTSILLVSHDTQAIRTFCSRAILIDKGKVILSGEPKIVMQRYESMLDGFMIDTKKITNNKKAEL
ncbi:ABC transporter ATP-binding protein, partial [Vibrio fluvialis]|nr:ABC transporter ATP-binding protein [Vibrio fluvialis]